MTIVQNLKSRMTIPAVAAPMFLISNPKMVVAQCKAGIVGSFPSLNARGDSPFESWLIEINEALDQYNSENPDKPAAPYAVNLIVHRTNARLEEDLALCVKYKVPVVITSLGAREDVNEAIHSYGGIVFHDIIDNRFAKKAIEKGADGLIAVAAGAGGHAGTTSPFALVQEIREWFDGPVLLSGCIANGSNILAALAMGADFAYIGSAFIATEEAKAEQDYKQMLVDCSAKDIVYSNLFSGVHGNYLKPSIKNAGMDPDNLADGDISAMADITSGEEKKAWKNIWGCGQGIAAVKSITTVKQRVDQLAVELQQARERLFATV